MDSRLYPSRYRISRSYQRDSRESNDEQPQAGPSRISPPDYIHDIRDSDEEDVDVEATPKVISKPTLDTIGGSRYSFAETPAARLRALLQVERGGPNASSEPPPRPPVPPSPSVMESDFDIPSVSGSSLARVELNSIFAHALRTPGDTPQKGRPRRNSIDVSEVEESPRVLDVQRERARIRGK